MIKKFWIKIIKKFFVVSIPTVVAIITIFTFFNKQIEIALQKIGVTGIILVFCFCFILTLIPEVNSIIQVIKNSENAYRNIDKLNKDTINNLLKTSALFIQYPSDLPQINIHLYSYQKEGQNEYLHKERMFAYETERLSVDYSLEKCRLDANNIVMCEAFVKNRVTFKNLPSNHISTYDSDVKDYIDKDIKWVLACPLWKNNNIDEKYGVIVVFGLKKIVNDNELEKISVLKNLCLELAKSVSEFI